MIIASVQACLNIDNRKKNKIGGLFLNIETITPMAN
jgi:hypothetical protein